MSRAFAKIFAIGLSIAFIIGLTGWRSYVVRSTNVKGEIVLLIPDDIEQKNVSILSAWLRAAKEEGIALTPLTASQYLLISNEQYKNIAGLILPDSIHRKLNDSVIDRISTYVNEGGNLLVTYDAGIENALGKYETSRSRMSTLVGIDFGLYANKKEAMIESGSILLNDHGISGLSFPPGRFIKQDETLHGAEKWLATSYRYPITQLPYFVTEHPSSTKILASSNTGNAILAEHKAGKGNVLFVNLPIGYLATQTDALFLHVLLKNFAWDKLHQPIHSSVPDGIGGLVMNWHIDAGNAQKYLAQMQQMGFYGQGPYSIHITTGPDTNRPGDKLGLNVTNNPDFQKWIREMEAVGHTIGSHGGWIHNYFAYSITNHPTQEHEKYLTLNKADIEKTINKKVDEYSAPGGNQPKWVTEWLIANGFKAFYTTSNIGLGPTKLLLDPSDKNTKSIWTFPVSTFGQAASFEEANNLEINNQVMSQWLSDMTSFCINERAARLIYFHPPGLSAYRDAVTQWLVKTKHYRDKEIFRWYTMSSLADFLERREATSWKQHSISRDAVLMEMNNAVDLVNQAWLLDKKYYKKPVVKKGNANVFEDKDVWRVVAQKGNHLELNLRTYEKSP